MVAIDIKTKEVLGIRASLSRSSLEAYLFLSQVRKKCLNRARLITDKAHRLLWTCRMLRHECKRLEKGTSIEQWFGLVKGKGEQIEGPGLVLRCCIIVLLA